MSNVLKIILIILLVLLVFAIGIGLYLFIKNDYSFDFLTKDAKIVEEKEFDSINNLSIDTDTADVYIKQSEDNKIKVELYSNDSKEHEISNTSDSLNVTLKNSCFFFCFFNRSKIVVYLPKTFNKNIIMHGSTSDLYIENDYENSDVNIKLSTGDIHAKKIHNANIVVSTGDIKIGSVYDIKTESSTGDVTIDKVNNSMDIKTTTGDVRISDVTITKNSNISTSTGDVTINSIKNVYVEGSTSTGDVRINNNDRKSDIELNIHTSTGDIRAN